MQRLSAPYFIVIFSFVSCTDSFHFGDVKGSINPTREGNFYISKFPDDKSAAVSFTFDDNCPSSFTKIAPIFERAGFRATFFIIAGAIRTENDWKKWKDLSDLGFEIGNHSLSHPDLTRIDSVSLEQEVNQSHELIKKNIGKAPLSFAHPGHKTNAVVDGQVAQKHLFSRINPKQFCDWQGWMTNTTLKDAISHIDLSIKRNKWYVISAHGVQDGWQPVSEDFLQKVVDYCVKNENVLAVETFQNIALYKTARQNSTLHVSKGKNKNIIVVKSDLSSNVYSYPLTLVIKNHQFPTPFIVYDVTTGDDVVQEYQIINDKITIKVILNKTYEIRWRER
jgi:peptidoglycan/xylan/chitin deacetylase (PgdA/CDA1 family)